MALTIPNSTEVVSASTNQARPDSRDFDILVAAQANYGVASGGIVTAQGSPNATVALAACSLVFSPPGGTQINLSVAGQNVNVLSGTGGLAADATNPRVDLIVCNSLGVVSCLHGTPAALTTTAGPAMPSRAAIGVDANGIISQVVLARIDVRANQTTVIASDIVDKRAFPQPPIVPLGAGQNAIAVYPGQLTQSLVTAAGIGAAFVLKAGIHSSVSIVPLNNQTFIGEPGAIMDGGMITRTATGFVGVTLSTLVSPDATFAGSDVSGTTPTYVSGMGFSSNAAAVISSSADSTHAVIGDTFGGRARIATDGTTTAPPGPTITSPTGLNAPNAAGFTSQDVGASITASNGAIPANTYIGVVNSTTSIGLSSSATSNVPVNATSVTGATISITPHQSTFNPTSARSISDLAINNSQTVTSPALGLFSIADIGAVITGTGIPANTWIKSITAPAPGATSSTAVLNNATTGGSQTVTATVTASINRTITLTRAPATGIDAAFKCTAGNVAANVTIRNLIVQNYATVTGRAAIHPQVLDDNTQLGANWIIEDCEVRSNASIGVRCGDHTVVRHCRIHDNGDMGIGGTGGNVLIDDDEVYANNAYNIPLGFDSCAMKLALTNGLIVRRCRVHDNLGIGIWTDVDCFGTLIENNTVWNNPGGGIIIETCYTTQVIRNVVYGNGVLNSDGSFYDAGNILISSSSHVEVAWNTVGNKTAGGYHGIGLLAQERVKVTSGGLRNVTCTTTSNTTLTATVGTFSRDDLYAKVSGTDISNGPPITTIVDVVDSTHATLSAAATGSGSGRVIAVQQQLDINGALLGAGGASSGWYQRLFDVSVHDNKVTTTGAHVSLAGLASDFANDQAMGFFTTRGIRFYNNTYQYDHGGDFFSFNNNAFNHLAAWQAFGMDQTMIQVAPTGYSPATELMPDPADVIGIQQAVDNPLSVTTFNVTGAVTIDLSAGLHQALTMTGNVTSLAVSNVPPLGARVILEFIQDGSGAHTRVNTGTNMRPAGGQLLTQTATASKADIYEWVSDGTSIKQIGAASINV